ncbi:putative membrane protein [Halobacteroides halobius DSM 5150]|uniref:Putative membrane protein n=1 Tax=Halobacteroides halobius (strain ATCC 35273 / DSM 5150 / MD-1) TaxID=748449 RepID=L0KB84_HALHC|nr:manganese efflux pump [Halobacteroides halobius]AGB41328.1 putative membrane protein [Halobacteroides halobius DSM 5150]
MLEIMPIAIALALDAFGVALGISCGNKLDKIERGNLILSFGSFQFLFVLLGALFGSYIDGNYFNISGYISGVVILLLGLLLLKEGHEDDEACVYTKLDLITYVILGVSVSIDALGIGFSVLYNLSLKLILLRATVIGLVACLLTFVSFVISNYIKSFMVIEKYADYLGGVILIIFGLKMIL